MAEDKNPDDEAQAAPGEPIDAEFEPIDEAEKKTRAPRRPVSIIFWAATLVLVLLLVLTGGYGLARKTGVLERGRVKQADVAQLAGRLDTLQSRLEALRRDVSSRLDALEQASAAQKSTSETVQSLQARLQKLENAAPVAADETGLDALNARLDALEQRLSQTGVTGTDGANGAVIKDLRARLQALEQALPQDGAARSQVQQRLNTLAQELKDVTARLQRLEQQGMQNNQRSALALAVLALDDAARTGQPFLHQWRALAHLAPQNADVLALEPLARTGVPTRAQLARDFTAQISAIRAAASKPANPSKAGLARRVKAAFAAMVSIRRIDGSGDGVDAALLRAQKALEQNDLNAAIAALDGLNGAAHEAAQDWIGKARTRLRFDELLAHLKAEAGQGTKTGARQEAAP